MIFKVTNSTNKDIETAFKKSMKKLGAFFSLDWTDNQPKVFLVPDRNTLNKLLGEKTEEWLVASSDYCDNIFLLSPENYERDSIHKYSEKEYHKLLTHELSHKFFQTVTSGNLPLWLDEGIAVYVSDQTEETSVTQFSRFLNSFSDMSEDSYIECGLAVKSLADKFGQVKLQELLESLSEAEITEESFRKLFKSIYKIEYNYESFNALLPN